MSSKFLVYTGDPADPMNQTVRSVDAETEEEAWRLMPHVISVQRFDPIDKPWRRTGDPDWEKLEGGIRVL